ncbi:MAG: ribosome recycling factor [Spirochaetes bacterium GWB1_36_13]|nr:MAG: ribosome recycling factor [Spirochaetes bacterium GWB1_36_13]
MSEGDLNSVKKNAESKMKKAIDHLLEDYKTIKTGRANVTLLDNVMVDSYGQKMPLNQLGALSTPDAHTIVIAPWDKSSIQAIQKAIETANLGLNPSNDGSMIRVPIPQLNEERRKEMVKLAKKKTEDAKIAIRNIRRDINEQVKKLEKDAGVSEDQVKKANDEIQKMTDKFIKDLEALLVKKEKEILEV